MTTIITWVFFIWVLYKLSRILNRGGRSLSEWLRDRRLRKSDVRYKQWEKEVQSDPAAKKMILEDADWLKSTR